MGWLSSVLPGLREIRGPLVAGYLWMLAIWLVLGSDLPTRESGNTYRRLWEVGDAIGVIGLAVVASVVAYVLGSLVHVGLEWAWRQFRRPTSHYWEKLQQPQFGRPASRYWEKLHLPPGWVPLSYILPSSPPTGTEVNSPTDRLVALGNQELDGARREWRRAVIRIENQLMENQLIENQRPRCYVRHVGVRDLALIPASAESPDAEAEFPVPRFAPDALIYDLNLIRTRLLEVAETTGQKVERVFSEADFRLALVPPLTAVVVVVAALQGDLLVLVLLAIPILLLGDAIRLRRQALLEVVDALRARSGTAELEVITPLFAIYRAEATAFANGIGQANWEAPWTYAHDDEVLRPQTGGEDQEAAT